MGKTGKLTDEEIVAQRINSNRHSRTFEPTKGAGQNKVTDLWGVLGEKQFAQEFGIPPDTIEADSPIKVKFFLSDGSRVKVCTTDAEMLVVQTRFIDENRFDIYVLARYDKKTDKTRLIGWTTPDIVAGHTPGYIGGYKKGHTPTHNVHPRSLFPIKELLDRHLPRTLSMF